MLNELEQKIRKAIPELLQTYETFYGDIIQKPIQLNHVLEYLKNVFPYNYTTWGFYIINKWNLKSNLLSEQS